MTTPGVYISSTDATPARSAPTDTGQWFIVGLTEKGDHTEPIQIKSMSQYASKLGDRVSYGALYDALDQFFREGGSSAWVGRVVGPTPVYATCNLYDASGSSDPADVALDVTATSVGAWGNSLNVEVTAGDAVGEFKIVVSHDTLGTLETSSSLVDRDAAVSWAESSDYIRLTLGASAEDPRVQGPTSLASGDDDRSNITDAEWVDAMDLFTKDMGPGQISAPGQTTAQRYADLMDHAFNNNRVEVLDGADTGTAATLLSAAATNRTLDGNRQGAMFAPWLEIPGLLPNTTRDNPPCALIAGLCARNDAAGSPNRPVAGDNGISRYTLDVKNTFSDSDRDSLNSAGVNVIRSLYGQIKNYGNRTLASPTTSSNYLQFANARMHMKLVAEFEAEAERFQFRQIDGQGLLLQEFKNALAARAVPFWEKGSLYGETFGDSCVVDVDSVNTAQTLADGELHALIGVRLSPGNDLTYIEVSRVPITENIA